MITRPVLDPKICIPQWICQVVPLLFLSSEKEGAENYRVVSNHMFEIGLVPDHDFYEGLLHGNHNLMTELCLVEPKLNLFFDDEFCNQYRGLWELPTDTKKQFGRRRFSELSGKTLHIAVRNHIDMNHELVNVDG